MVRIYTYTVWYPGTELWRVTSSSGLVYDSITIGTNNPTTGGNDADTDA